MLQNIKEKKIRKKFVKALSKSLENKEISQKEIKTVGIITLHSIAKDYKLKDQISTVLNVNNVHQFCFKKFHKSDEVSYHQFTEKDIDWKGEFVNTNLESFLNQSFDLLIGYFNTNHLYLEKAVLESMATFKVGFANVNSSLFDIEIAEKIENSHQFFHELKKYLQILKKLKK